MIFTHPLNNVKDQNTSLLMSGCVIFLNIFSQENNLHISLHAAVSHIHADWRPHSWNHWVETRTSAWLSNWQGYTPPDGQKMQSAFSDATHSHSVHWEQLYRIMMTDGNRWLLQNKWSFFPFLTVGAFFVCCSSFCFSHLVSTTFHVLINVIDVTSEDVTHTSRGWE